MANKYLAREDAPFDGKIWELLDNLMLEMAKSQLTGRRLLSVLGPFGLGLKAIPLRDVETESGLLSSEMLPLFMMHEAFQLAMRDFAAYERDALGLHAKPLIEAARRCAQQEDDIIFNGALGVQGLTTSEGTNSLKLLAWDEVGTAAGAIIQAVTLLDKAGFHGPYSLALAPERYNLLLRRYPEHGQTELSHIQTIVTEGIFKAPVLEDGGILLATHAHAAHIVLGQDMTLGFIGPVGHKLEFSISESLALRVRYPQAICVLES